MPVEAEEGLIEAASVRAGIEPDVVRALIGLEDQFPDFTIFGAKTEFTKRVGSILDAAAVKAGKSA